MDPLDRLRRLIALASNPATPTEEARTSAMIVVKMIVEKKIVLSLLADSKRTTEEMWEEIARATGGAASRPRRRAPKSTPPPRDEEIPQKRIRAKFSSRCGRCAAYLAVGEEIWWTKGLTPHCVPCGPITKHPDPSEGEDEDGWVDMGNL